jgi:hypothetical protein
MNESLSSLQKAMVKQFKEDFFKKFDYKPLVVISVSDDVDFMPHMTLQELQNYFDHFLPVVNGKKLSLNTKRRFREIVELRFIYCFLSRQLGYRQIEIARALNKRDHTTIVHNLKIFSNLMETNDYFKEKYKTIYNYIMEASKSKINESPAVDSIN